jgi:hypothetical protein
MDEINATASDVLRFQTKRSFTTVFKESLVMLEELRDEHIEALERLKAALPQEYHKYVDLANYFSNGKMDKMRRRILTNGNNSARNVDEQITNLKIDFK